MPHIVADRVLETTTTTGTGALTLSAAVIGFRRFNAVCAVADTVPYFVEAVDSNNVPTGDWEAGVGTYSAANTLTRTTVTASSNAGAAVNFAAGTKLVSIGNIAARAVVQNDRGVVEIAQVAAAGPNTPPAGVLGLFARSLGGRLMLAQIGPSGLDTSLMPHIGRNGISWWVPAANSTTINVLGANALTATGTATAANYATTDIHTRGARVDYLVTTAATTAVAGYRAAQNNWRRQEGFHHIFRVSPATGGTVSTRRFFVGMAGATAAPTDVNPSTQTNIIGYGYDSADTNWQVMHNDGSGTATKVDTGIARPSTDRPSIYSVFIFCGPNASAVGVGFIDESNGNSHSATLSTDLPTLTQTMGPRAYHSVGGTSSVVGLTLFRGIMDTDN